VKLRQLLTILLLGSIAVISFVLGLFSSEYFTGVNLRQIAISDQEFIRIAQETVEAQKFLEKYPKATANVDRSGRLAVDFRVDTPDVTDSIYLRLRVFIDHRTFWPTERFIDCSGHYIEKGLLEYLQTERCIQ
jgi:hypothetical protein